jgi:hypothetical protein
MAIVGVHCKDKRKMQKEKKCNCKNLQSFLKQKIPCKLNLYTKFANTSKHNEHCTST